MLMSRIPLSQSTAQLSSRLPLQLFRRSLTTVSQSRAAAAVSQQQLQRSKQQDRPPWDIRMLYDGECPLCMREVNFLRDRDAKLNKIDFVDIAATDYDPQQNNGITYEQAMLMIHAITAQGQVLTGVEVFKRLYEAVGLGWVYGVTSYAPIGRAADALYSFWAKYRMEVTGRQGGMAAVLERKRAERAGREGSLCEGQQDCQLPAASAPGKAAVSTLKSE